jgi:Ca2+/Na+ antiporter
MAVSNALGSNIFNICMALGVPWLLSTAIDANIIVESKSLVYTTLILVGALLLYGSMLIVGNFHLRTVAGAILIVCYLIYSGFEVWAEWHRISERGEM